MKNKLIKDKIKRENYKKLEIERLKWLIIKNNAILPLDTRKIANMSDISKLGSRTLIRNRCLLTSRPRGVIKKWGISRIKMKELAERGALAGIRKASW